MRVYVGQTRSASLVRRLWRLGIGECCVRGELPPRRHPYFYDNGAYKDWTAKKAFDSTAFLRDVEDIYLSIDRPEWIVLPDQVAGGVESLHESLRWVPRLKGLAPLYLAVQDGMDPSHLTDLRNIGGLFVGGTLPWKIRTAPGWRRFAHSQGLRCHVGRVGTPSRVRWALREGFDSIDSALPLWSEDNLARFLDALEPGSQSELFGAAA